MNIKSKIMIGVAMAEMAIFAAKPTVTDVTAKQRYPWNGLVDISCKVEGVDESMGDWCFVLSAVFPNGSTRLRETVQQHR